MYSYSCWELMLTASMTLQLQCLVLHRHDLKACCAAHVRGSEIINLQRLSWVIKKLCHIIANSLRCCSDCGFTSSCKISSASYTQKVENRFSDMGSTKARDKTVVKLQAVLAGKVARLGMLFFGLMSWGLTGGQQTEYNTHKSTKWYVRWIQ